VKKLVASILVAAVAIVLTIAAVALLVGATIRISTMSNIVLRASAAVGAFLAGCVWLLATVYVVTHIAVLIFGRDLQPGNGQASR
jgi:hypothetical protein